MAILLKCAMLEAHIFTSGTERSSRNQIVPIVYSDIFYRRSWQARETDEPSSGFSRIATREASQVRDIIDLDELTANELVCSSAARSDSGACTYVFRRIGIELGDRTFFGRLLHVIDLVTDNLL